MAKKSPPQDTGLGNRDPLKALNDTKLILHDVGGHSCSFRTNLRSIIQNLQTFHIPKASFLIGTFLATSYSKPALKAKKNLQAQKYKKIKKMYLYIFQVGSYSYDMTKMLFKVSKLTFIHKQSIILDYSIEIRNLHEKDKIFLAGALGNYSLAGFEMVSSNVSWVMEFLTREYKISLII